MIQRVQTLYLLIAAIFTGILLFIPMASFCGVVLAGDLTAWQIELTDAAGNVLIQPIHLLGILLLCAALLPLITIFLFRKRKLQMRLCLIEVCLLIASFGAFAYYYTQQNNDEMEKNGFTAAVPVDRGHRLCADGTLAYRQGRSARPLAGPHPLNVPAKNSDNKIND